VRRSVLILTLVAMAACSRQAPPPAAEGQAPMNLVRGTYPSGGGTVNLPQAIGPWTRPDVPTRITAEGIFDYMDGAGELYVGYRFGHLDVFEYKAADGSLGTILVELYSMKDTADAFGLLSTDWGGEVPPFGESGGRAVPGTPAHRALYGAGLLRMWHGRLYVRVLAARETAQSREAVLTIGREVARDDNGAPGTLPADSPPLLLDALRGTRGHTGVRPDRTCFFRSHLVLNSAYYLASEDILGLGLDVEGLTTEVAPAAAGGRPTRLILVRYPAPARARAALNTFTTAYLPEVARKGAVGHTGAAQLEHGWAGWALNVRDLSIALDASSEVAARELAASTVEAASKSGSADK